MNLKMKNYMATRWSKKLLNCSMGALFFTLILFASAVPLKSQSFEEWIEEVSNTTKLMDNVEMKISIKALNLEDNSILYENNFLVLKKDKSSYYKMEDTEMMHDGYYNLIINHNTKTVNLFRADDQHLAQSPEIMSLDSIMRFYSNPVLLSETDRLINFEVSQEMSFIPKIEIKIDKLKKEVITIAYNYKIDQSDEFGNRVEMHFASRELTTTNQQLLEIERYIKKNMDKVELTARFEGYQLYTLD